MEGGCLPITTAESGIPYHPFGVYERGNPEPLKRAFECTHDTFYDLQQDMKSFIDAVYDNEKFKNAVRKEIGKLLCTV